MDATVIVILVVVALVVLNVISFGLMAYDKRCARQGKWRVPEKRLFLVTACFGGLGGVLGMKVFHHKTQHWYFKVFFPVMLIVQVVLLAVGAYWLYR